MADDHPLSSPASAIDISCLERLIVLGLSDTDIEVCFSLADGEVELLRRRHNLSAASSAGRLGALLDLVARSNLDEISNGLQAAGSYVGSAIKCAKRDRVDMNITIMLMEKSLEQILRVGKAYHSLQADAKPATE